MTIADGHAHVEAVAKALSTFGQEARNTIDEADGLGDADTAIFLPKSRAELTNGCGLWKLILKLPSKGAC